MAIAASFRAPAALGRAVAALGFVQADPVRAPARAQDLILRHRVTDYRVGELEHRFARLQLEEDFLYAYGFMPRATWRLLHPRHDVTSPDGRHIPTGLAAEVLAFVRSRRVTHPRDLGAAFGRERALNGWGGWSKATTRALHSLQYHGLLRVARRQDGIRVYQAAAPHPEPGEPAARAREIVLLVTRILAPISERGLRATIGLLQRGAPGLGDMRAAIQTLLADGALEAAELDGERFLWPAGSGRTEDAPRRVRLLAPFDPLVWERRRFEFLWGWDYRFEAYTPPAERRFGYYAMPLLWGDAVIGWANVTLVGGKPQVAPGFIDAAPKGRDFRHALDAEIASFTTFLQPR
jgi:hypothetical protein